MQIVWGATGRADTLSLTASGDAWQLEGDLLLGGYWTWDHAMCANESTLGPAKFEFADHDHDGRVDLVIKGHQTSSNCSDDYSFETEGEVILTGVLDTRIPKAMAPMAGVEPVHGLEISWTAPRFRSASHKR